MMEELRELENGLEKWAYFADIDLMMFNEQMCNLLDSTRQVKPIYADYTIKIYYKLLKDFLETRKSNTDATALMSEFAEFLRENAIHAFINPEEILLYKDILDKDKYKELDQILCVSNM